MQSNKVNQDIAEAQNLEEIEAMISLAVAKHLCALLAIEDDEISLDIPFERLGLDSLIAIELKNWITRSFQAGMQTSEIQDARSITALANLVATRSALVASYRQENSKLKQTMTESRIIVPLSGQSTTSGMLPRLPLPDLDSTLQEYLTSVGVFCSQKELDKTINSVQDFQRPGGLGVVLQQRLQQRAANPEVDNWQHDLFTQHCYLKVRAPINPFGSFFFSHKSDSETMHGQAERAAILSMTAFEFRQQLEAGLVKQDVLNEQPLSMNSLGWLFNTNREPRIGVDKMQRFPGNDYVIVLQRGHIYKAMFKEGG